jgi:hypothetical protein
LLLLVPSASRPDGFETTVSQEISAGGMARVLGRDPGLIGGGNGGSGTSINYDDGNLNYGRGLTALAVQGRSRVEGRSATSEIRIDAVYFYDFVNADGETDFRPLSDAARRRAGRDLYLNDAYFGVRGRSSEALYSVRVGNQILRWSDSPSFGHSIAPVNPTSASRRYQPGNTARDAYVALPMLSGRIDYENHGSAQAFYQFGFKGTEPEAAGTFLSSNDYYSPGGRFIQLGQGSPLVPDTEASVITPATPFGSKVARTADRLPPSSGQFGARLETPELGTARTGRLCNARPHARAHRKHKYRHIRRIAANNGA